MTCKIWYLISRTVSEDDAPIQAIFFRRRHQLTSITNDPSDQSTTLLMGPPPHKLGQYEGRRLPSLRSNASV
jgi:hypothetical protein